MYAFLTKLLVSGKVRFDEGTIWLFNQPFSLIPLTSFKQMTDDAMERDLRAISDLYFYGWVYGYTVTKSLIAALNLKIFEERYKISMDIVSMVGFGDYRTLEFVRGKFAHFKVIENHFGMMYYPSDKFVCHYLRGMEAGGGTLVHETLMNNIEFECAAVNGHNCVHKNLNQEELSKVDRKLVESQLDIPYLKERQRKVVEHCGDDPKKFGF